jgi:hypothetical protein
MGAFDEVGDVIAQLSANAAHLPLDFLGLRGPVCRGGH